MQIKAEKILYDLFIYKKNGTTQQVQKELTKKMWVPSRKKQVDDDDDGDSNN